MSEQADNTFPDCIFIGKLNRIPKPLRVELGEGPSLRSCREALEEAGHSWRLLSGAMVFVHPRQYPVVRAALDDAELRPYHVVFAESLGYLMEETLARCKGAWITSTTPVCRFGHESRIEDDEVLDEATDIGEGDDAKDVVACAGRPWAVRVQRTFVCIAPASAAESHYAASTTRAHCPDALNPRAAVSRCADS